jgi:hypothetical protein
MDLTIIFKPLKDKKSLELFLLSSIIITIIYFSFSIFLSLLSTKPFPKGSLTEVLLFGGLKAFSTFVFYDWFILALFPIFGGLLFANYTYWKCKTNTTASTGLVAGLLATTCPACILPVVGLSSFVTFLTKINIYIKIVGLLVVISTTYYVAINHEKCSTDRLE